MVLLSKEITEKLIWRNIFRWEFPHCAQLISLVKLLFSRNFCRTSVRENFCNFHTVNCELHSNRILMSCRVAILFQIFRVNNVFPNKSYYELIWRNIFQVYCIFLIFQHSTLHAALITVFQSYYSVSSLETTIFRQIISLLRVNFRSIFLSSYLTPYFDTHMGAIHVLFCPQ